jgi:hypothetical protein
VGWAGVISSFLRISGRLPPQPHPHRTTHDATTAGLEGRIFLSWRLAIRAFTASCSPPQCSGSAPSAPSNPDFTRSFTTTAATNVAMRGVRACALGEEDTMEPHEGLGSLWAACDSDSFLLDGAECGKLKTSVTQQGGSRYETSPDTLTTT